MRRATAEHALAGVALLVFLLLSWPRFVPWSANVVAFNSDAAIPLIMANSRKLDPFFLYYLGQDRFGGWPFLLAQGVGTLLNHYWSAGDLYTMQWVWVILGAIPVAVLLPRLPKLMAAVYLLTVFLVADYARHVFALHLYVGWQLTTLLAAWACMRLAVNRVEGDGAGPPHWKFWLATCGAIAFGALGVWTHLLNGPWLIAVGGLELGRLVTLRAVALKQTVGTALVLTALIAPSVLGIGLERVVRSFHAAFSEAAYGGVHVTDTSLDDQYLGENVTAFRAVLSSSRAGILVQIAIVATPLVLIAGVVRRRLQNTEDAHLETGLVDALTFSTIAYVLGCLAFLAAASTVWTRLNNYDARYIAPVYLFFPLALVVGLAALVWSVRAWQWRWFDTRVATVALLAAVFCLPAVGRNDTYYAAEAAAAELEQRAPGTILVGGHWGTYVIAGLQRPPSATPVVMEGDYDKMPWTVGDLPRQGEVVVSTYALPKSAPYHEQSSLVVDHGRLFRLIQPNWFEAGGVHFARYRVEPLRTVAYRSQPALDRWGLCARDSAIDLSFSPQMAIEVIATLPEWLVGGAPKLEAEALAAGAALPAGAVTVLSSKGDVQVVFRIVSNGTPFDGLELWVETPVPVSLGGSTNCSFQAFQVLEYAPPADQ